MSEVGLFTLGFIIAMLAVAALILYGYDLFWEVYRRGGARV